MRDLSGRGSGRRPPVPGRGRSGPNGTNGHSFDRRVGQPLGVVGHDEDEPVDLVELQADDELINALSAGYGVSAPGYQGYDADDRLVAMLASWKADVDAEPIPELVEPDVALEVLAPPTVRSRRASYLRPVIAAVAVAACGLGVLSVSAHEAQPGDALWGLSKVLYSERAGQVQAAADLRTGIEAVNQKLARGDTAGAQQDLAALAPLVGQVAPGADQDYFRQQQQFLTAKLAETPPGVPTDPTAPLLNGTTAPRPPDTEGGQDPGPGTEPGPGPGVTPVVPADPGSQNPSGGAVGGGGGSTTPTGESPSPGSPDPRMLREQGPSQPDDPSTGPTDTGSPTSPTTEGSPDPTTPTASGEGSSDRPTSSTGAVSSTPR